MKIAYSFGMVDLMHYGHITALQKASENSDMSIFGLVSDAASDAWYGAHVSDEDERKTVLESVKYVDRVMYQETFDPLDNLRIIHAQYPDAVIILYTGNEWGTISAKRYVESIGGEVVKLDYYDKLSPQKIMEVLKNNVTTGKRVSNNLISTKANTLLALHSVLTKSRIEDICVVQVGEYRKDADGISEMVSKQFDHKRIVVRSSSKREDAFEDSNAGHFTSILNVDSSDALAVQHAISAVISSYGEETEDDEQVLIQTQTENVSVSGVIFTKDIQKNRPYYVINYDASGSTDSVTAGVSGTSVWLSHTITRDNVPEKWEKLMEAVWEIEDTLPGVLLDIEFAITDSGVVIFQVRPLAAAYKFLRQDDSKSTENAKKEAVQKYLRCAEKGLSCFSDMAFWNPAEIIGDNPRNLDYSLYREIITKLAWDEGLVPMGYRNVSKELMYRFGNKPYISIERSFEALMPANISDTLAEKLMHHYIRKFICDPSAHDKIEFEISHNCFDFAMHKRLKELAADGFEFSEIQEFETALKSLTVRIISEYGSVLEKDQMDLKELEGIRIDVQNITKGSSNIKLLAKSVHNILDSVEKYGTAQFSRQARCAFIAKSVCLSLVKEGYLEQEEYDKFFSGIRTVAGEYEKDYQSAAVGLLSKEEFYHKYGHLRAGTYNIRSLRYDQIDDLLSKPSAGGRYNDTAEEVIDNTSILSALTKALADNPCIKLSSDMVLDFIERATTEREYFKFVFTKSLSLAIEIIKEMGYMVGLGPDDLSFLELPEIYAAEYYDDDGKLGEFWRLIIEKRRELFGVNSELILPDIICSPNDFSYVENIVSRPNFITKGNISGDVVVLNEEVVQEQLDGKIVVLEKADPGYDWIFAKGIAGLVTKYGGAASHMAIRCAEFKIPAVIGCGAALFDMACESKRLSIDCKQEKMIRV